MNGLIPRVMTLAPGGVLDPRPVVAGCRAGALGVLDFSVGHFSPDCATDALRRIVRYTERPFGIRLRVADLARAGLESAPESLRTVILVGPDGGDWKRAFEGIDRFGRQVMAEVTSRDSAQAALGAGADGLVLAGHGAGGDVGDESTFVLLQGVMSEAPDAQVWVRGIAGPRGAAACAVAGASGVVLDGAILLARESPLPAEIRQRIARWDGSETTVLGEGPNGRFRCFAPPGSAVLSRLRKAASQDDATWRAAVAANAGWGPDQAWPVGQDAAQAQVLAHENVTIGGIVQEAERGFGDIAGAVDALGEGSPLALAHGTRYPIVQGPMTRVSDTVPFAAAVADAGGLPFLALALLRGPDVQPLLDQAARELAGRSWGVGILGFVTPELRLEQIEAIRAAHPPFALIAGGRPDQARVLEREGIATYLHVPSPGLLRQFLKEGSRRFVLEGRECGGHVGPRCSFILWEQAIGVLREAIAQGVSAEELHILFAGGIHDGRSAAMVAAIAAPLVRAGVRIGVLAGTAYLFTDEAVATGAIVPGFQAEAVRCARTVLLETGPGHEVRVSPTPFADAFASERQRLIAEGLSAEAVREALERLNAGRLRLAAKGVDRSDGASSPLVTFGPDEQQTRGIYMLGEIAALRNGVTTIRGLHEEISRGSIAILERAQLVSEAADLPPRPSDIAIVGMAAFFPGAPDVRTFWENTLRGVDAITEVPPERWDWRLYYDPDPKAPDRITSKWGGFLPPIPFDPLSYGMPPASLPSIEPMHLLTLEAVRAAIADAGYQERAFPRERTAVVLGAGGGAAQLAMGYAFRSYLPLLDTVLPGAGSEALRQSAGVLPAWTEDSFPGILLNVAAGRVANRFDFGGANFTVDAACGSSLAAAYLAVRELETGAADVAILAGADTVQNPFTYLAFSKTHAFSARGRCRPFDANADGIVISEGVAALVLKRLADAERDGDRIYAVIKGVAASSDGRAKGMTAPRPEGQVLALERAYAKAGISPETVGYVEAHGTGTAAGDSAEVGALARVFAAAGAARRSCAVGSVKSLIGHTKCAAGLAGLINASLALYHQVYPPTIGVEKLNVRANWDESPLYVSTQPRPWLHGGKAYPRRAGVSAFGFGGTNFHAVLEAFDRDPMPASPPTRTWPAELLVWKGADRARLVADIDHLHDALERGAHPHLRELAHSLGVAADRDSERAGGPTLAIVASDLNDLKVKLGQAREALREGRDRIEDPRGVFFEERPSRGGARVALVFPGQGAQYPGMLADLAMTFPEVQETFETFDATLESRGCETIGPLVFPPPAWSDAERDSQALALRPTTVAQPAVGAACVGLMRVLASLGLEPDVAAGHSYGELVALHAAGSLSVEALAALSEARGRLMLTAVGEDPGSMAALAAGPDRAKEILNGIAGALIVNLNGPAQTVISGTTPAVTRAVERAREMGLRAQLLPVACAFHSPLVGGAREPLAALAASLNPAAPRFPVYGNTHAKAYPVDAGVIPGLLGDHLARPVRFAEMTEAMYSDGIRVFIEAGPGATLAPLIRSILGDRPALVVSCDRAGQPGITSLLLALGRLYAAGVPLRLERLTEGRASRRLDVRRLAQESVEPPLPASAWLVDGARARPAFGPETRFFGAGPALPVPEHVVGSAPSVSSRPGATVVDTGVVPSTLNLASAPAGSSAAAPAVRAGSDRVLAAFQKNMESFLELQRSTMLAYLAGRPASAPVPAAANQGEMGGQAVCRPGPVSNQPNGNGVSAANGIHPRTSPKSHASDLPGRARGNGHYSPRNEQATGATSGGLAASTPQSGAAAERGRAKSAGGNGLHGANGRENGSTNGHDSHGRERAGSHGEELARPRAAEPAYDRKSVSARLLSIVQERTGYPAEMLDLNLDLEADLGIDSIKRVEILGMLRDAIPAIDAHADPNAMDALSRAKTLGAIVDRLANVLEATCELGRSYAAPKIPANGHGHDRTNGGYGAAGGPRHGALYSTQVSSSVEGPVRRLVLEAVDCPLPASAVGLMPGGIVIVTEDGRGISRALAAEFKYLGHPVVRVRHGLEYGAGDSEEADLTSPEAVSSLVERIRRRGPLAGLVHTLPLREMPPSGVDARAWQSRIGPEVRGLFLLAKATAGELERAAKHGGACMIAATGLGGTFGTSDIVAADLFPGHGAIAGLAKTIAREWTSIRTRVVDLDLNDEPEVLAATLVREVMADDGRIEVGHRHGRRAIVKAIEVPLDGPDHPEVALAPGEPLLVTGGARGITAAVVADLARRWRPNLLLLGSSPWPAGEEDTATAGQNSVADLKRILQGQLQRRSGSVSLADVERAYQALCREREIRANVQRFREAGATVQYARVDVRDADALGKTLIDWRRRFGDPVGVIHAAGVIQDKLLRDKSIDSFDRVMSTKVDSALTLARVLRHEPLKFAAFFSSIAGRFGNRGQGDYAAANEALNKLALWLDRRWACRVLSVLWGPWSTIGMVSDLEEHLERQGLGMIPPELGASLLADELLRGRKGDVEVIMAGDLGTLEQPLGPSRDRRAAGVVG